MKYLISEDRLNSLISSYLDQMDWWEWDIGDGEFNLSDGRFEPNKILFRIQHSSMISTNYSEVIYISEYFVDKISKLFSLPSKLVVEQVIQWFNKKYNMSLTTDNFQWMDTDYDDYEDYEN